MQELTPILRARRERRLAKQRKRSTRGRSVLLTIGTVFSLVFAVLIIITAVAYANITRDLPSVENLPHLLNPPDDSLLQPPRIYDRPGSQLYYTSPQPVCPCR